MHEIVESFINYVRKKGYSVHENANPNTGKGTIQWIHEVEKKGGALPVNYFEKYVNGWDDDGMEYELDLEEVFITFTQKF